MYDYRLIRSDRRTLALEITADLQVVIRAPRRCSQREIARFAADHEGWVMTHLPIQQRRMEARAARTVTPEHTVRIYGEVETKHSRDSEIEVERFEIL